MGSCACTILGSAVLALLLAGYLGQRYLPPPKPKILGIDLGTTYSCIGAYHAVLGTVDILPDSEGHLCIPSVVAFSGDRVLIGYEAVAQADHNPGNTIYDAKRFIGKYFSLDELAVEAVRYPFKLELDSSGMPHYVVNISDTWTAVSPELVGSHIIRQLRETAERNLSGPVTRAVMAVPAEFNGIQRNYTRMAARLAGIDVLRIINEPTAAALAYGLHKRPGAHDVLVIDLGGGTLDVSLLDIQGGMFLTRAMAGNNHLGGQDFNERLRSNLTAEIEHKFGITLTDPEDVQSLRTTVEQVKLDLTSNHTALVDLHLRSLASEKTGFVGKFRHVVSRRTFEELNEDLFRKVLEPVDRILDDTELVPSDIEEVVLVGGSTRVPRIRRLIAEYFGGREPNVAVDPELAVATGISVQAGIIGGMWPLTVSAVEVPTVAKKVFIH